ncbi:hypothetical protein HZA45_00835 [Candidatus Peregrinibacteria bacterium]|nr:hypothetical protein [Candidatus Peregrinibacteria bacterium]
MKVFLGMRMVQTILSSFTYAFSCISVSDRLWYQRGSRREHRREHGALCQCGFLGRFLWFCFFPIADDDAVGFDKYSEYFSSGARVTWCYSAAFHRNKSHHHHNNKSADMHKKN